MNKVHNTKQTDWDLHVPAVLWAYRTACKHPTPQALPRLEYQGTIVNPIIQGDVAPRILAPIDITVHGTPEEEIKLGNYRLQELEK